jgi:hypothetical protein
MLKKKRRLSPAGDVNRSASQGRTMELSGSRISLLPGPMGAPTSNKATVGGGNSARAVSTGNGIKPPFKTITVRFSANPAARKTMPGLLMFRRQKVSSIP